MKYADKQNNANYHLNKNDNTYFHNVSYKPFFEVMLSSKYIRMFRKKVNENESEVYRSNNQFYDQFFVVKIRNNKYY